MAARGPTNAFAESLYAQTRQSPSTTPVSKATDTKNEPVTPVSQYPSPLPKTRLDPDHTPTGRWAHPAVSKITQLQSRRAPNETTLRRVILNAAAFFVLYKLSPWIYQSKFLNNLQGENYVNYTMYTLYVLLAYNVFENARRFFWINSYDDPTLTAKQRALLNLPASPKASSIVDSSHAITPPRYQKSFTPSPSTLSPLSNQNGRRSSLGTYSPSNQAGKQNNGSPLVRASPMQSRSLNPRSVSMASGDSPSDFASQSTFRNSPSQQNNLSSSLRSTLI